MSKLRWTLLASLGSIFIIVVACAGVPITGRSQLRFVSNEDLIPAANQEFDRFLAVVERKKILLDVSDSPEALRTVEMVNRVTDRILEASGMKQKYNWQTIIVKAKEPNAFVMPNGKIVVFAGLLPITKTEAGLAAVIGHEAGHLVAQHRAERVSQALVGEFAVQAVNLGLQIAQSPYQPIVAAAVGLGSIWSSLAIQPRA